MEFDKSINSVLRDVITKVDNRLQVCRNAGISYQDARLQLFDIVNKMGEASARAQGLAGAITTGRRLETSDHHVYIMKDTEGSSGQGAVIGILKIGRKRLFVYDRHGQQWEMNPLCVLDFYVHESRQRMGCGRRLFDFMLKEENTAPQHLAVDRPSVKFSSFLAKHYGLRTEIPQVNNFVIFEGFFTKHPDGDFIHNRRSANQAKPADYPGRGAVENYNNSGAQLYNYSHTNTSLPGHSARPPSGPHTKTMPAGLPSVLPRHQIHGYHQDNPLKDLNLNPRPAQTLAGSGSCTPGGLSEVELRSVSAGSSGKMKGGATNLPLQATMYSRHQTQDSFNPPHYTTAHRPPTGNKNTTSALANNVRQRPPSSSNNATADFRQQLPSGNKNATARRENSPPMLRRDGPPRDYLQSLNLHHNYQGRAGHLLVTSDPKVGGMQTSATATATTPSVSQPEKCVPSLNTGQSSANNGHSAQSFRGGYYTNPALHTNADTSWTVFGALRKQDYYNARHSGRTRLW